jgi:hypothetical protein
MSKIITVVFLSLVIIAGAFRATHSPVYGNCHQTIDGHVCTLLKWQANK